MSVDEGASPMRRLVTRGSGFAFRFFHSLDEAKTSDRAWVVLEGDDGGQVYAVFTARSVHCSQTALTQLVEDIDARYWNDNSMARVAYELRQEGDDVGGGMGGGLAKAEGWIHPQFTADNLDAPIRRVIADSSVTF